MVKADRKTEERIECIKGTYMKFESYVRLRNERSYNFVIHIGLKEGYMSEERGVMIMIG